MPLTSLRACPSATGSHAVTVAPSAFSRAESTSEDASRMSSVFRLERQSEQRHAPADEATQVLVQLADHAALLQLVDLDHRRQQLEVIAGVGPPAASARRRP